MTTWNQATAPATTWNAGSSVSTNWGATPYFLQGQPIGLLLALTYHFNSIPTDAWNAVTQPATSWVAAT